MCTQVDTGRVGCGSCRESNFTPTHSYYQVTVGMAGSPPQARRLRTMIISAPFLVVSTVCHYMFFIISLLNYFCSGFFISASIKARSNENCHEGTIPIWTRRHSSTKCKRIKLAKFRTHGHPEPNSHYSHCTLHIHSSQFHSDWGAIH